MTDQEWITMTDPNEGAFQVQMPGGWQNQAYMIRPFGQIRSVVTARSPDGSVFLFMGDPNLPTFNEPSAVPMEFLQMTANPLSRVHPYVTADLFFQQDIQQRYGQNPGFRITSVGPNPELERLSHENARKHGISARVTAVAIAFDFSENGSIRHALLHGATVGMGAIWLPDVSGIVTSSDPGRYRSLLFHMVRSYQTNPQWRQYQDSLHAQQMGQIQRDHQSAMAAMQAGHQARMHDIHQAGAANTRIWNERQAQNAASHQSFMNTIHAPTPAATEGDPSHKRFINYIRDENTVMDSSGQTYQVDTGHDRYYVNKNDNTYVGTDSTTEREDLRSRFGLDPDRYEETKIKP